MTAETKPALIRTALFAYVTALARDLGFDPDEGGDVAWPDVEFEPNATDDGKFKPYLVVDIVPNRPAWEGVKTGRLDQGLLQILAVYPAGTGSITPALMVGRIMAGFPVSAPIAADDVIVRVARAPFESPPIPVNDRTSYPVTVAWVA